MYKKFIVLFCVTFITQTKSDKCLEDFFKCFSEFANSFFLNTTETEHVNVENIPDGFKQVKDVQIKTVKELTDSIQKELLKQSKSHFSNDVVVVKDNPNTQIYVKTYVGDFFEHSFLPDFENFNVDDEYNNEDEEGRNKITTKGANEHVNIENHSSINEKQITPTTENSLVISPKTTIDYKNTDKTRVTLDIHSLTTQKPDSNKYNTKSDQKPTVKSTIIPKHNTQNIQKPESQKDVTETISTANNSNNETSIYSKQEEKAIARSATPNRNAQKVLTKNQFEKDIRENIIQTNDGIDYDVEDSTDYPQIDYIDLYKDTTNEENEYVPTDNPKSATIDIKDEIIENIEEYSLDIQTDLDNDTSTNICHGNTSDVSNIFPWIATIFIKNDSANSQFQYTCDGALLGDKLLLTAARCIIVDNSTVNPDDVLVFLGKKSLQSIGDNEKHVRISQIIIHSNFSAKEGMVSNDLALLVMEKPVIFSDSIRPACLGEDNAVEKSATTAWDLTGALTPVFFEKDGNCREQINVDGTICATYGNEVPLCPSYGGLYTTRRASRWYLGGVRSGLPERLCFTKEVHYTPLGDQLEWIMDNMA